MQKFEQERPEDSTEYLQDLNGHNQEILWERVQEASQASDAQIEYEADLISLDGHMEMEHMTLQFPKREV